MRNKVEKCTCSIRQADLSWGKSGSGLRISGGKISAGYLKTQHCQPNGWHIKCYFHYIKRSHRVINSDSGLRWNHWSVSLLAHLFKIKKGSPLVKISACTCMHNKYPGSDQVSNRMSFCYVHVYANNQINESNVNSWNAEESVPTYPKHTKALCSDFSAYLARKKSFKILDLCRNTAASVLCLVKESSEFSQRSPWI